VALINNVWAVNPRIGSWQPTDGTPFGLKYETLRPAK
jgi:hypothetical protein